MKDDLNIIKNKKKQLAELQLQVEIEQFIVESFEINFERLRMEGGHAIAPEVKRQALLQVLMYYRKLKDIAETVTDTEVKLTLPQQTSPNGNKFTIEGVVDIVRDNYKGTTTMYDIKTHDADFVRGNIENYDKQLNVYTHIWQKLRNQKLDATAVVATQFPHPLKKALDEDDEAKIEREIEKWNPVIPIPFSSDSVDSTITQFACVVDKIEGRQFSPPSVAKLKEAVQGTKEKFATRVCRNCDARYSCESYRDFSQENESFRGGFAEYISDLGLNEEIENWTNTNSLEAPAPDNINDLI